MTERRPGIRPRDLARGPGRLTKALGLDLGHHGLDLLDPAAPVRLAPGTLGADAGLIRTGPRVGVSGPGGDGDTYPWRYWLADEPTVSAYRPAVVRRRLPRH